MGAGAAPLAAQRAPLRRPHRPGQGGDQGPVRRRAVHGLAAQLRRPAAADAARPPLRRARRPPLRRPARPTSSRRPSAWPTWWCACCPTGTTPSPPTCWRGRDGAGRRPRQQPPRPDQAPRRHLRRRRSPSWRSRPACRSSTSSTPHWRWSASASSATPTPSPRPPKPSAAKATAGGAVKARPRGRCLWLTDS